MRPTMFLVLLVTLFELAACGGCGGDSWKGLAWGYRVLTYSAELTETIDKGFAEYAQAEHLRCEKLHPSKTPEFAACVKPALELLRKWTGQNRGSSSGAGVLPSIQSAQRAARLALDAAFDFLKAKGSACKPDDAECKAKLEAWKAAIKPGLCSLAEIVDLAVKIGAYKATTSTAYVAVREAAGAVCK